MFARTERLLLRPAWAEDAVELTGAIADESIVRNLVRAPWPYGREDADSFIDMMARTTDPTFLITLRTGGAPKIVGGVGISEVDGEPNLGYWIARPYWGLGFATEAARAVLGIARALNMPPIKAAHMVDNPASGQVLRKLGFKPTGRVVKRYSAGRGTEVATVEYTEGQGSECSAVSPLKNGMWQNHNNPDEDLRRSIRLMAA